MRDKLRQTTPATMLGLLAPLLWCTTVPLVRGIAEEFGITQGEFLLYAIAAASLLFTLGLPDFKRTDPKYLVFGTASAVSCSLCFVFSIFLSSGGKQTLEVGMINYLWPAMTILFAVLFTGQRASKMLVPGLLLSMAGVFWILSGGEFSFSDFAGRISQNPLSYLLALGSAVTWSTYSTVAKKWGKGVNLSTLIFMIDSAIFGILWLCGVGESEAVTVRGIVSVFFGGFAMATAYAVWTHGVQYGKITILSIASYFTPVLSCIFGVLWLGAELGASFWTGVAVLTVGSLICWKSTS